MIIRPYFFLLTFNMLKSRMGSIPTLEAKMPRKGIPMREHRYFSGLPPNTTRGRCTGAMCAYEGIFFNLLCSGLAPRESAARFVVRRLVWVKIPPKGHLSQRYSFE